MAKGKKMKVEEIMTKDPEVCTRETSLQTVARMMVDCNCGEIPVVEDEKIFKPLGVVTDRDIVVRLIAEGRNPLDLTAGDCMSEPCITVTPETDLKECFRIMEKHKIRRIPVVDSEGRCCGIVAQADLAVKASPRDTAEVVREISQAA